MKKVISLILLISILFTMFAGVNVTANAIGNYGVDLNKECYKQRNSPLNPYAKPECTWYCWGRTYEKLGISLPSGKSYWGNANTWDESAEKDSRFRVGTEPRANSIMVENSSGYGHVMFVEKVENGYAYITESNYLGKSYFEDRINLTTMVRDSWKNHVLSPVRYIYLRCANHKWDKGKVTTKATCTSNGVKTYTCTVCGETKAETIKGGHKYKTIGTIKATLRTPGVVGKKCTVCNKAVKTTIYCPKTASSNKLKVTYNGKYQKYGVTVKDTKGNVIPSKYYSLSYVNNKYVGNAGITIKFTGLYSGTKKAAFMIVPKGTSLKAVKGANSTSINVYWNRQTTQTSGYQIQYSTNSKFAKNNKSFTAKTDTAGKTVKGLKAGTTYYFRIRTYMKKAGFPYYSGWSKVLSAKTKLAADSKSVLLSKAKKLTNLKITNVYYSDYDGDGKKELFALAGGLNSRLKNQKLLFVSTKQAKLIPFSYGRKKDSPNVKWYWDSDSPYLGGIFKASCVKVSKKQRLFIASGFQTGSVHQSIWFYVKGGKVHGNNQEFYDITQTNGLNFTVTDDNLDTLFRTDGTPMGGHTWKPYYFKWTGSKFAEYKGIQISQKTFKKYKNSATILNQIKASGYKVNKIYKRSNGIVNINVRQTRHDSYGDYVVCENVNCRIKGNQLVLIINYKNGDNIVEKSSLGGIYKASYFNNVKF